ncbi:MAG TPA: hypothetical protein VIY48_14120 [Candidatus Paceibacterota bacterium]
MRVTIGVERAFRISLDVSESEWKKVIEALKSVEKHHPENSPARMSLGVLFTFFNEIDDEIPAQYDDY